EADGQRSDETPGPDPEPQTHTTSVTTNIIDDDYLLMRIGTLKRDAEEVEECRDEVDIREAQGKPGNCPGK
ncbi:hypothetical protein LTR60_007438, partial [Cryomyces antarcticus]